MQGSEDKPDDLLDANLGVTDDDLLGDFGDNFNILEFADALGKGSLKRKNLPP